MGEEGLSREGLAQLPLHALAEIEEKLGRKRFAQIMLGGGAEPAAAPRAARGAPAELSSKARVPKGRRVVKRVRTAARDPRFDELSGTCDAGAFERRYAFVEEMQEKEEAEVRHTARKVKSKSRKAGLMVRAPAGEGGGGHGDGWADRRTQRLHQSMVDKRQQRVEARNEREAKMQRNRDERARVAEGKRPYFLKEGDAKALKVLEAYGGDGGGGQEERVRRRRKRAAGKLGRRMPKL